MDAEVLLFAVIVAAVLYIVLFRPNDTPGRSWAFRLINAVLAWLLAHHTLR